MPVSKLNIEDFLRKSTGFPVLDVRSPKEYDHAHIPGAVTLPIFSNEEREVIGTAYNHAGRETAVNLGLNYFSGKMREVQPLALQAFNKTGKEGMPTFFVHCWRGGMRSGAVAWLLSLYGYKVYVLEGGYKSFRRWVLNKFEGDFKINILGGYSGSGKTDLLLKLKESGKKIIDLEALANHRGSAFGSLGMPAQPSQEMFENLLAAELDKNEQTQPGESVWVEDESRHIGKSFLPNPFWEKMRKSPFYFFEIPFESRLDFITGEYSRFAPEELKQAVLKIQKRLGGQNAKDAIAFIDQHNPKEAFRTLLKYYDKMYEKSIRDHQENGVELHKISSLDVDIKNAALL